MKKKQLRKDEIRRLSSEIAELYKKDLDLGKKDHIEMLDEKVITINKAPSFFMEGERPVPMIRCLISDDEIVMKKVVVDMGAVKFVTSGADVMRPGITQIDDGILEGYPVLIVDETHGKPLAIGKALFDSDDMEDMDSGKVIEIIHHVGDNLWKEFT